MSIFVTIVSIQPYFRKAQTKLINDSMVGDGKGKFQLDKTKPIFQESLSKSTGSYWDKGEVAYPRGIAETMWGSAAKLDAAVADGSCKEIDEDGSQFYSWKNLKIGARGSTNNTKQLQGGRAQITSDQYDQMASIITGTTWAFNHTKAESKAII